MKHHLVAFADVLGVSNATKSIETSQQMCESLILAHNRLSTRISELSSTTGISVNFYSDSLIMSSELKGEESIALVINNMAFCQATCALHGLFLRGSLSMGLHYHSDTIDFGPALVEAVTNERKLSGNSMKITLSSHLSELVTKLGLNVIYDNTTKTHFLSFLDILNLEKDITTLKCHIEKALKKLDNGLDGGRALKKMQWMARYYNWHYSNSEKIYVPTKEFSR